MHETNECIKDYFGPTGLATFFEQFVQVTKFEQSIAVHPIAMHQKLSTGCPVAKSVEYDSHVFGDCGGVQVIGKFRQGIPLL